MQQSLFFYQDDTIVYDSDRNGCDMIDRLKMKKFTSWGIVISRIFSLMLIMKRNCDPKDFKMYNLNGRIGK